METHAESLKEEMNAREKQAFDLGYELGRSHARRLEASKQKKPHMPVVGVRFAARGSKRWESLERVDWNGVVKATK
jgi:hypothetical protein